MQLETQDALPKHLVPEGAHAPQPGQAKVLEGRRLMINCKSHILQMLMIQDGHKNAILWYEAFNAALARIFFFTVGLTFSLL